MTNLSCVFGMTFVLDSLSKVFLLMVIPVSSAVLLYSVKYFQVENSNKFTFTLSLFILSMIVLSVSGDVISLMIGWDGLGLSSLCLILFYPSWKSSGGGLITFVTNRLGDVSLMFAIFLVLVEGNEKSFGVVGDSWILSSLILLGGITNSAQLPFAAWLPLAMAAPTPVSSLVHSSTLVTGGVYVFSRFGHFLSEGALWALSLSSALTVILAGSSSLNEMDLKKIVALSTLTHIGLVIFFQSNGFVEVGLFHILIHAYFKSLLFMSVGELIHGGLSSQDIRILSLSPLSEGVRLSLTVSLLGIIGVPFLSGYYSNELFLSSAFVQSVFSFVVCFLGAFFTVAYSTRMLFFVHTNTSLSLSSSEVELSSNLLLLWSLSTVFSGVLAKSFFFGVNGVESFPLGLLLLFFLGVLSGVVLLTNKMGSVPLPLIGGNEGMWSVWWLTTTPSLCVWTLSGSVTRKVDVFGAITSLSESFKYLKSESVEVFFRSLSFLGCSVFLLSVSFTCLYLQ